MELGGGPRYPKPGGWCMEPGGPGWCIDVGGPGGPGNNFTINYFLLDSLNVYIYLDSARFEI